MAFGERVIANAFGDGFGFKLLRRDGTNDAVAVARRHQEYRNTASVNQALLDRLVAVAVAQRQLIIAHARGHDGAVRGRCTVEY